MTPAVRPPCTRRAALLGVAAALCTLHGTVAQAQTFPAKAVRVVVPFAAGGVGDLTARIVGQALAQRLGQPVVIDNRPGAGGVVAAETVARAEPDGHTLLLMSNGTAVTASLFRTLSYDTLHDFAPVSTLGTFDMAVLTPADAPFKTLADVVQHARQHPGQLNIGCINIGSTQHLTAELFKSAAGLNAQVVPFNGTPALVNALRGHQVDVAVEVLAPTLGQVRGGVLRVLATTGPHRSTTLPQVPTAEEAGVKGLVASSWNALAAPARTPRDVVARLNQEVQAVLAQPDVQKKLSDLNIDAHPARPEQTADLLATDIRRWNGVIDRAGIARQ